MNTHSAGLKCSKGTGQDRKQMPPITAFPVAWKCFRDFISAKNAPDIFIFTMKLIFLTPSSLFSHLTPINIKHLYSAQQSLISVFSFFITIEHIYLGFHDNNKINCLKQLLSQNFHFLT